MSTPLCPNCHKPVEDAGTAIYCASCGARLDKHEDQAIASNTSFVNPFIAGSHPPLGQAMNPLAPANQFSQDEHGFFSTAPLAGYDVIGTQVTPKGGISGHLRLHGDRLSFSTGKTEINIMLAQITVLDYDTKKRTIIIKNMKEEKFFFKALNAKAFVYKINQLLRNPNNALSGKGYAVMRSRGREGWAYLGGGLACISTAAPAFFLIPFLILAIICVPIGIGMIAYGGKYIHDANYAKK